MTIIQATLCFVLRNKPLRQVLLGYKKRGFGKGKYDGFGGKRQQGEDLPSTAARELYEEASLSVNPSELISLGVITFIFPYKHDWDQEVHIFLTEQWVGTPQESEEMRPQWFSLDEIPLSQMWDDSRIWLPYTLTGQAIRAFFTMNKDNDTVKEYTLQLL